MRSQVRFPAGHRPARPAWPSSIVKTIFISSILTSDAARRPQRSAGSSLIVCHCQGVTDRAIRKAVNEGATTVRQVARSCRAGRMCGGCRPLIAEIIAEETAQTCSAPGFTGAEGVVGAG